jgi:hypothetical protein
MMRALDLTRGTPQPGMIGALVRLQEKEPAKDVAVTPAPAGAQLPFHLPEAPNKSLEGELVPGTAALRMRAEPNGARFTSLREVFAADHRQGDELLEKYFKVYERFFPDPNEREPLDVLRGYLTDPTSSWDLLLLRTPRRRVMGGCHWNVLPTQNDGTWSVMEHVWLTEKDRAKDLFGQALAHVGATLQASHPDARGVVGEVNDPRLMTRAEVQEDKESSLDPALRERMWGQRGVRKFDAPYIQPKMAADGSPVEYLSFAVYAFDRDTKSVPKSTFLAIARSYFENSFAYIKENKIDVGALDTFVRMAEATPETVRIIPTTERRRSAQMRLDV